MDFTKSDKSLAFMKKVFLALAWITGITLAILGIVMLANSSVQVGYHKETDSSMVLSGILLLIGGPLLAVLEYYISMFVVWIAFDIKVIRNAATKTPDSQILKDFVTPPVYVAPTVAQPNNNAKDEQIEKLMARIDSLEKQNENTKEE